MVLFFSRLTFKDATSASFGCSKFLRKKSLGYMNGHAPTRGLEFFFLFCKFILECGTFWGDDFLIEFTIGHKHTLTIHFQDKRSICKSPDGWSVEDSISVRIINKKIKKRLSDSLDGAILFLCVSTGLFFYCTFLSFFIFLSRSSAGGFFSLCAFPSCFVFLV